MATAVLPAERQPCGAVRDGKIIALPVAHRRKVQAVQDNILPVHNLTGTPARKKITLT